MDAKSPSLFTRIIDKTSCMPCQLYQNRHCYFLKYKHKSFGVVVRYRERQTERERERESERERVELTRFIYRYMKNAKTVHMGMPVCRPVAEIVWTVYPVIE